MISQKIVQQELRRKGGIHFADEKEMLKTITKAAVSSIRLKSALKSLITESRLVAAAKDLPISDSVKKEIDKAVYGIVNASTVLDRLPDMLEREHNALEAKFRK